MVRRLVAVLIFVGLNVFAGSCAFAQTGSYRQVYAFQGGSDGSGPNGKLLNVDGVLYGTTASDGSTTCDPNGACGSIFSLDPTTGTEKVLYGFQGGNDGGEPQAGLVRIGGVLYGTTIIGGSGGGGVVFSLNIKTGREKVVYSFSGGSDGYWPCELTNVGGILFGTTNYGGVDSATCRNSSCGTVFSLDPKTKSLKTLYAFKGGSDGANPGVRLVDIGGLLYGTTPYGGNSPNCGYSSGCGTLFSVDPTSGAEKILSIFQEIRRPFPQSSLIQIRYKLYGTTDGGGDAAAGTVYSYSLKTGVVEVLHSFGGGSDGQYPLGDMVDVAGTLYGTTNQGGGGTVCGATYFCGTLFSLNLATGQETTLHSFPDGIDGYYPKGLIKVGGTLYGATGSGGQNANGGGYGTVYAFTPEPH